MPLVRIVSSATPPAPARVDALLRTLSQKVSALLHKPEQWVMTCMEPQARMTMGGTGAPACYVEVKNVGGFTQNETRALTAIVCSEIAPALGVAPERIYVEFANAEAHLWGWNGETFAD